MKKIIAILALVVAIIAVFVWLSPSKEAPNPANNTTQTTNTTTETGTEPLSTMPYLDGENDLPLKSKASPTLGTYLTDSNGFTLYTFKKDGEQKSNCNGTCAETWIPFLSFGDTKIQTYTDNLTKQANYTERADGKAQFSFGPRPLYYYKGDLKAGDTNGQGLDGGNWSVVVLPQ